MYNRELAIAILKRLDELFPNPTTSSDLRQFQVKGFEAEPEQKWHEAIDALIKRGSVTGQAIRDGQLIVSAANLEITQHGLSELAKGGSLVPMQRSNIVFLSHAAKDQEIALRLKQTIENAVPGCAVFVSSDTVDIRPGEQWVQKILNTLEGAGILLILATDRSIARPWVWFETGAGWRSKLKTIPCCLGGTRKSALPAPFSHYQGLNLDDDRDLNALFNELSKTLNLPIQKVDTQSVITECQRLDNLIGDVAAPLPSAEEMQRRLDLTHVSVKITHGNAVNFMMTLTNESDEKLRVVEIALVNERGVRLTEPRYLTEFNKIEPRGQLNTAWRMETNPADKLVALLKAKGEFPKSIFGQFEAELEVIVTCEVLGKVKQSKTKLYVRVDSGMHRIDQIAG